MNNSGTLYVVATPIGNLDDITVRAVKTLFTVDGIACEDTRRTGQLLRQLQPMYSKLVYYTSRENSSREERRRAELISYYEQNELRRIPEIITALKNGVNIALVSDAGTPAISDPGFKLIRECIREGIRVESIPGPSSVISALITSGLPTDKFLFVGYPPRKPGHRMKFFEHIKKSQEDLKSTVIFFEAPHKLLKTLEEMQSVFGDSEIVIARELTKVYEEVRRGKFSKTIAHYQEKEPRGEFVILLTLKLP
ncbi:MAG: 16S rRNA (cytidine(1402)-2'-O)-methyltransferase [Candidatus Levybacteria bacterium]|nr:16S rRNA (cytidine(1402)-2'-O)-methyltransferase [Candidatus Levybacteria bacterium]